MPLEQGTEQMGYRMEGDWLFYTLLSSCECYAVLMVCLFKECNFLENYFRKKSNFFETQSFQSIF